MIETFPSAPAVHGKLARLLRWPGSWRTAINARLTCLEADIDTAVVAQGYVITADGIEPREGVEAPRPEVPHIRKEVLKHVAVARWHIDENRGWRTWLSGSAIEGAQHNMRLASAHLIRLQPYNQVRARETEVLHELRTWLPDDTTRAGKIKTNLKEKQEDLARDYMSEALKAVNLEQGKQRAQLRTFRNILLVTTAILTVVVVGFLVMGSLRPQAFPLCFPMPATTSGDVATTPSGDVNAKQVPTWLCPTGETKTPGHNREDTFIVALYGLMGAALAAAIFISKTQRTEVAYSFTTVQAVLKVPSGVASAVLGIVALGSGLFPVVPGLSSQGGILTWAVVFGYSQQLFTRLLDRRAEQLLGTGQPAAVAPQPDAIPLPGPPVA
jgi:hypothetical protein